MVDRGATRGRESFPPYCADQIIQGPLPNDCWSYDRQLREARRAARPEWGDRNDRRDVFWTSLPSTENAITVFVTGAGLISLGLFLTRTKIRTGPEILLPD